MVLNAKRADRVKEEYKQGLRGDVLRFEASKSIPLIP